MSSLNAQQAVPTTALAASLVISAGPCVVTACAGQIDSTAPSADYYVQLIDSTAAVDTGGAIRLKHVIKITHVNGIADYWSFASYIPTAGTRFPTGAVVQLSSTLAVGTLAGSYLLGSGSR